MRLVLGVQPVREAVRAHGESIEQVLVEEGDHPQLEALARFARDQGIDVTVAARAELDRRARGARHQGVMALVPELRLHSLASLTVDPSSLFLALDEIQDPQNFGAEECSGQMTALAPNAIAHLGELGATSVALDASGDVPLADVDLAGPVLFVIGSEGKGLKKSVRRACARTARLPMGGAIDSLNASVAAAVALYEARRQRRPKE
jgi:23S rRNA (guanosine2251-2'-O)-methyltransferase